MFLELPERIEAQQFPGRAPALVLLHEGLGSVGAWRAFPETLAARTGHAVWSYSRPGYGASDPAEVPRPVTFMHQEAERLERVLAAMNVQNAFLVGHSDGASIALLYAAQHPEVRGVVAIAPHVFVEDLTVRSIAAVKQRYAATDLRVKLARHHRDVDHAFFGWNDVWLDPAFRSWNIEAEVARIEAPLLLIQGDADEYGTLAQLASIESRARGPLRTLLVPGAGHAPHRDDPDRVIAAIQDFVGRNRSAADE